jgi:hypothetical protein
MFFVNPGVRVPGRNRVSQSRVLSVLFRWLIGADCRCLRMGSRFYEAEFPLVRLIVYRFSLLLRSADRTGSPARDRAPMKIAALRPFNNWVKPEDQYGILSIGKERPAFARRLPQTGRQSESLPLSERALARSGKKIASPANHGPFHWRWKTGGETGGATRADAGEWFGADGTAFA